MSTARIFLPTLRELDRDLSVPLPERLRILQELESDLEGLRKQLEARGVPTEEARRRAVEALVPQGGSLQALSHLHAPLYRRLTWRLTDDRLRLIERWTLALATTFVVIAQGLILARVEPLSDPSPFLWPVLGLGAVLFATVAAKAFQLWIKRDHGEAGRGLAAILVLCGATLALGVVGAFLEFIQLLTVLEATPRADSSLFFAWLVPACSLLSVSILLALAGGLAWFILSQWLGLLTGARSELLGLHSHRHPPPRRSTP